MPVTTPRKTTLAVAVLALVVGVTGACSGDSSDETSSGSDRSSTTTTAVPQVKEAGDRASFFLKAATQVEAGSTVVIDEAVLAERSGWLVIHLDIVGLPAVQGGSGNRAGAILGVSSLLPPGATTPVTVTLKEPIPAGSQIVAMIHTEDNANGTFDYPAADEPAMAANELVVIPIEVVASDA